MSASDLNVLSVNAYDMFGGAERVAVGLHSAYLERGLDSWLALGHKTVDLPHVVELEHRRFRRPWARGLAPLVAAARAHSRHSRDAARFVSRGLQVLSEPRRYARIAQGYEDFDFPGTQHLLELVPSTPDVLHLHNLHGGYFDIRALPDLSRHVPTIATLHDAWLLTGHCAHPLECERWRTGCGDCPHLDMYVRVPGDKSAMNWDTKRAVVSRSRLRVATPSQWLMRLVEESGIAENLLDTRVIPNGVDTALFAPGSKTEARRRLGLPPDASIVMFAARELENNPFKDYQTLTAALPDIAHDRPGDVALVGLGATGAGARVGGADVIAVPFVDDTATMVAYYRAADVYIHAAKAENLPLAVIEAMACGTPVVASRVGGVPEIVVDGESGLLVDVGSAQQMARATTRLLDDPELRERMSIAGTRRAREVFALERQVDAYVAWYEELAETDSAS